MSTLSLEGAIKVIGDVEVKTEKFSSRNLVISVQDGNYTNDVNFQCTNAKTSILDAFKVGQNVKVSFNLKSQEFKGKWYLNATAWRVEATGASQSQPQQNTQPEAQNQNWTAPGQDNQNLPF